MSKTDYDGAFVYLNNELLIIHQPEGRIVPPAYDNLIANKEADGTAGFNASGNVTVSNESITSQNYVKVICNQTTGNPGIFPIGNTYAVQPGEKYSFSILGFRQTNANAYLKVTDGNNNMVVWTGALLNQGAANENIVTTEFIVPPGITQIKIGVLWSNPALNETFYINRVALYKVDWEYQYYLADHLGNNRVILQTNPAMRTHTATMESENHQNENYKWINLDPNRYAVGGNVTPGGDQSIMLNKDYRVGPAKSFMVFPGDKIDAQVSAYFTNNSGWQQSATGAMISAVASVLSNNSQAVIDAVNNSYAASGNPLLTLLTNNGSATYPSAFLNYILTDEDYVPLKAKSFPVTNNPNAYQLLMLDATIQVQEMGYLFVYLSYDNENTIPVYFDDFKITYTESPVVQVNGFYPYGMAAYTYLREGENDNKFLYQGKEYDSKTGWHDFHARQYDATLGRWFATDPAGQFASPYLGMGNNPVMGIDPDGKLYLWDDAIVAAVGFIYGYVSYGIQHNDWGGKAFANGGINAAMFELGYLSGGGGAAAVEKAGAANVGVGLSTGVVENGAAGSFIANKAISITLSQVFQPIPVYQSQNFSLTVSPTFGTNSIGVSANASYRIDDDLSIGVSTGLMKSGNGSYETRTSGGVTYKEKSTIAITYYGGTDPQWNWLARQKLGKYGSVAMSNDVGFGSDKYRTAALEFGYRDASIGMNIYTNDPKGSKSETIYGPESESHIHDDHVPKRVMFKKNSRDFGMWKDGVRLSSPLYFG